jgi:protein-tyrosine kinase
VESNIAKLPHLGQTDQDPAATPPRAARARRTSPLGEMMILAGKLTEVDVKRILKAQVAEPLLFGELAVKLGLLNEADVRHGLARQFSYPYLDERNARVSLELFTAFRPFSPAVEQLRDLRSKLILGWFRRNRQGLAIVGARAGAGCSYITGNLGVLFAQTGVNTLIIDADLRTPRQHGMFRTSNRIGLTDVLSGAQAADAVTKVDGLPGLSLMSSGTLVPNPQELLVGDELPGLLNVLARDYPVVLVDTSPCLMSSDAQTVISAIGGAAMVVRKDRTPLSEVRAVQDQCETAGAQLIGSIFNRY